MVYPAVYPVAYLPVYPVVYLVLANGFYSACLDFYVLLVISLVGLVTAGHGILRQILLESSADRVRPYQDSFATRALGILVRRTMEADSSISLQTSRRAFCLSSTHLLFHMHLPWNH